MAIAGQQIKEKPKDHYKNLLDKIKLCWIKDTNCSKRCMAYNKTGWASIKCDALHYLSFLEKIAEE